jgi:hypothetical protein
MILSDPQSYCRSHLRILYYSVTYQPTVGLRNSGCDPLLSDSSVNRFPSTHDDVITGVGDCHVLKWLLRDMPRWCHTAPGVGEYHMTSTFPQVTSHTLQLRPLPRYVAVNNLPRNNMGRCLFCSPCKGVILKTNGATQTVVGGDEKESLKSETVKYGPEYQETRTLEDCAGKGQQHIQKTDPSSRQRGRPTKNKTVTVKQ